MAPARRIPKDSSGGGSIVDDYVKSVPDDWRHDRLKDVASLRSEKTDEKSSVEDYLELEDIESWSMRILNWRNTEEVESAVTKFEKGDVLFGKLRPYLAKVCRPYKSGKCTGEILAIHPTHIDGGYLQYALIDPEVIKKCTLFSYGAKMPRVNWATQLSTFEIPIPPRPEQERIAAFLDEKCAAVDKAIEVKRKQLESVEPQWANLLHNVTLRGIRPSRLQKTTNAIIEKIPVGWKLKRLRYIGRCQNGISKDGQYFGYGFPFVTYGDVYNNMALPVVASGLVESTEDERVRYSVKRGDIFFTRTSETADEVGFSSVCLKTIPDATFAGFVIRVRPVTEDLLPEFAQYYFRNPFVSQYFAREMMVVTRASLSQDILKSLPVLIPPRDEQSQIAQYLGERRRYFDSLAVNLQKQIETLEQYHKSLIHEYVTGVRRVV